MDSIEDIYFKAAIITGKAVDKAYGVKCHPILSEIQNLKSRQQVENFFSKHQVSDKVEISKYLFLSMGAPLLTIGRFNCGRDANYVYEFYMKKFLDGWWRNPERNWITKWRISRMSKKFRRALNEGL